ncbi:hypothetical protein Moror_9424 [Moniliophthora roreri MCA 2997]|uniref:Uncharacterized protein n=1 Tax=Moniliophthora roreri (strain MCA 2997) TaxID=1381753 RepID=V2WGN0_MONRO|nr:hypothetical protein Moror_9424 [Moniliophthora roreri MCA 2997]
MATTSLNESPFPERSSIRDLPVEILLRHTTSPLHRLVIEQLASDAEKELTVYQAEIDRLRVSPAFLKRKRDGLKEKLSQYRSLLSPAHWLPPEILGYIFSIFNDLSNHEKWLQPSKTAPALVVSGTCGKWRDVALSFPSLWSSIFIRFEEQWEDPEYHRLDLITRLFLERSQKSPLKLTLMFDDLLSLDDGDGAVSILKILVRHCERWHTVEFLFMAQRVIAHEVFKPIAGCLPILTNLRFSGVEDKTEGPLDFHCDLFSDCPALISVACKLHCPFAMSWPLPWGQIRSLCIDNTYTADTVLIASFCPNIERLVIKWCGGDVYTGDHLCIPGVTHLSIAAVDADEAYCIFKYLTLPRLSSLEISCTDGRDHAKYLPWIEWDEQYIADFFRRSAGCSVTSLLLKYVPISDEQLIQLLRFMPALSSLRIVESGLYLFGNPNLTITRRFLQRLSIDDTAPPLLPKLTNIKLVLHDDDLVSDVLPNALRSRWITDDMKLKIGVECIKSIDVTLIAESREIFEVLTTKLQFLRDAGAWVTLGRLN